MQPSISRLLKHFKIAKFEQVCYGDLLHESAVSGVFRNAFLQPMQGSLRFRGGAGSLVDALTSAIPATIDRYDPQVTRVDAQDGAVAAVATSRNCDRVIESKQVAKRRCQNAGLQ